MSTAPDNFNLRTQSNTPNTNWSIGSGDGAGNLDAAKPYIVSNVSYIALMSGNVGIGTTGPGAKLEVSGDTRFGCRSGFWKVGDGRLCVESTLRGTGTAWAAIGACKGVAPGCRVCTHTDMQQACGAGFAPYGAAPGWYGDHGVSAGGNWDDEFGTWNNSSCNDNNDGPATDAGAQSIYYRCCY